MEVLLPDSVSLTVAASLIIFSFFTSALTATAGVGGGLLMLGFMSYVLPITALIPVHGLVQLGSNASRSWIQRENINWPIVLTFMTGGIIGALIGAMLIIQLPEKALYSLIGFFVLIMVWVKLPALQASNKFVIAAGGLITNFISMFAGATGPLVAVFINHLFERHREMVATHGMAMTAQHSFKILAFGVVGFSFKAWVPLICTMIFMGFLGAKAGTSLMYKLPEKMLKTGFKFVITIIALDMLRRAFF